MNKVIDDLKAGRTDAASIKQARGALAGQRCFCYYYYYYYYYYYWYD